MFTERAFYFIHDNGMLLERAFYCFVLLISISLLRMVVSTITGVVEIDYGFWGILVPVFASISDNRNKKLFF